MSTNPFKKHVNTLCADRGADVDASIAYASEVINALPPESRAYAMTALMVVVNTAANAFEQARGPSPEKLAVEDMIRAFVTRELDNQTDKMLETVNDAIREWNSENLTDSIREVLNDEDIHSDHIREVVKDMINDGDLTLSIDVN